MAHRPLLLVPSLVVGWACTPPVAPLPFEPAGPAAAPDPSVMGPFPVGVRTFTVVDDSRPSRLHDGGRSLTVEVWYPATEAARGQPGLTYVLYDALPEDVRGTLQPADLGTLDTPAVQDAAPRTDQGPFPLVVFSHGKGGIRMQSTFYTVFLASHGYVVASPDHEGDTIVDQLREGDFNVTSTAGSFIDRPLDVSFVLDQFEALPTDHPLAGTFDMERVGVTGHSFGALTTFITAGNDSRVKAIVAQAPVGVGLVEIASEVPVDKLRMPVAIQSGSLDRTLPEELHAQSLWDNLARPRHWLSLRSGGHFTYSDLCVLDVEAIDAALEIDASNVLTDGCGAENLPTDRAFPAIRQFAVGFFNAYLRQSLGSLALLDQAHATALLGGDEARYQAER